MKTKTKTTNPVIADENNKLREAVQNQFAVQQKIFAFLNGFARGDHMKDWSRVEFQDVIAQVYGDLAAHFGELKALATPPPTPARQGR